MAEVDRLLTLTAEEVEACAEEPFRLVVGGGDPLVARLSDVRRLGRHTAVEGAVRDPFAMTLITDEKRWFAQQIVGVEHPRLGRLDVFLVPIGPDAKAGGGMRYEAVFT